jgi:hypothetical protein
MTARVTAARKALSASTPSRATSASVRHGTRPASKVTTPP